MLILMVLALSLVSTLRISHLQSFFDDSANPIDPIDPPVDGDESIDGGISWIPFMTGVPSNVNTIPVDNLSGEYQEMDQFIRDSLPELQGATLISISEQVVAGKRYCFTYEYELLAEDGSSLGPTQSEYCVWNQPWENDYYRLETDDGRIFVKGGSAGSFSAVLLGSA